MNQKFTYRELMLLLGVGVALLVIFILWFNQAPVQQSTDLEKSGVPHLTAPLKNSFAKKALVEIKDFLIH